MKAVLIGNYGVSNLGDEALKDYFLRAFPEVRWCVLSANPKPGEFPRLPFGFRSLLTPWWKTIVAIRHSDVVVFGGGSLFTDVESVKACWLWWWHAMWARFFRKPVLLAFQGVGPFQTRKGEALARSVIQKSAFVSVRDEASAQRINSWGLNTKVVQSFDPVFSLIEAKKETMNTKNVITLIPRKNSGKSFENAAQKIVSENRNSEVAIVLLQGDDPDERVYAMSLQKIFPTASIQSVKTLVELVDVLSDASHVVTERYHAALLAYGLGCPLTIVSQKEGDKLSELQKIIDRGDDPSRSIQDVKRGETALREAFSTAITS